MSGESVTLVSGVNGEVVTAAASPMLASIADLASDHIDIFNIAKSMQDSMNELEKKYKAREEQYRNVTTKLKGDYEAIMQEARSKAECVVAAAVAQGETIIATANEESSAWFVEKDRLAHVQAFKPQVKLDVGGNRFTTSLTTLQRFPDTMIGAMFSGRHALPLDDEGYFFIDRDGTYFRHILNFLRQPEGFDVDDLPAGQRKELKRECEYYGLLELMFPKSVPVAPVRAAPVTAAPVAMVPAATGASGSSRLAQRIYHTNA